MPKKNASKQQEPEQELVGAPLTVVDTFDDPAPTPPAPAPKKVARTRQVYRAYAPFELKGVQYAAGDEVAIPDDFVRDTHFEEFRNIETNREHPPLGLAFTVVGDYIGVRKPGEPETRERAVFRYVLPIEEA